MGRGVTASKATFLHGAIANMRVDVLHAAYTKVPPTWAEHDYVPEFNKLYFIMEGTGYLKIGGVEYDPKPGELYWMPEGVRQSYATKGEDTFGKHWCHFAATVGDEPLYRVLDAPVRVRIVEAERGKLADAFERLSFWRTQGELGAALRARAELLTILATFLEHGEGAKVRMASSGSMERMNRVLQHVEAHLHEPLTVEELAALAHYHPNYFIRQFKRTTGYSPIRYINGRRIERAKSLFATTALNVSEVADRFGMEVSYFSRLFKETTGFTPSQYREMFT
ncbi:AraC family transcriptional regulator [Paenibacillus sp.]|uniref:AraC family transcriptional regulator n=1 Tax=Paenibacillus sp. TaxID=58172 RepID=UPI002D5D112C|nr:AraC family transcriptional regulator [Paenibacillus sp.]HZG54867.1 AraC family transcriptional regulator [Paenibacillus sp.]